MDNLMVQIIDCETGTEIIREMTSDEIAQYELDKASSIARAQEKLDQATTKAALLARLGITAEEAQLLLGGN